MSIWVPAVVVATSALVLLGAGRARQLVHEGLHYQAAGIPFAFTVGGIAGYARSRWSVFAVGTGVAAILTLAMLARAARFTSRG